MVLKYGKIIFHSNFLIRGQKPTVSSFGKFGKKNCILFQSLMKAINASLNCFVFYFVLFLFIFDIFRVYWNALN